MAGNNAAYQQLRPLEGDISRDVQYWNNDGLRKRQEDRIVEQEQYDRDQAVKTERQANYDKWVKPLNNYDTGSQSLNEINGRLLQQATKQYLPLLKTIEDPNASEGDQIQARIRLSNLQTLPEKMKTFTDVQTAQDNAYKEGVEAGTIWRNEEYENRYKNGYAGIELGLDDQFNPVGAFVDKDGDGVMDMVSYDQVSSGQPTFNVQKKFNLGAIAQDVASNIGTTDVTTVSKDGLTTNQNKTANLEGIEAAAQKLFFTADGKPTEAGISALRDKGLDYKKPKSEDLETIKTEFVSQVRANTDEIHKKDFDYTGQTGRINANRLAKGDNTPVGEPVTPTEATWGDYANQAAPGSKSVPVNVELGNMKDGSEDISNPTAKNIMFDASGQMIANVEVQSAKSSRLAKKKEDWMTKIRKLNEEGEDGISELQQDPRYKDKTFSEIYEIINAQVQSLDLELSSISIGESITTKTVKVPAEKASEIAAQSGGMEALKKKAGYVEGAAKSSEPAFDADAFYKNYKSGG